MGTIVIVEPLIEATLFQSLEGFMVDGNYLNPVQALLQDGFNP